MRHDCGYVFNKKIFKNEVGYVIADKRRCENEGQGYNVWVSGYTKNLKHVVIQDSIEGHDIFSIGYDAFKDCQSLKSAIIPENIKAIQIRAFENCSNLESVHTFGNILELTSCVFKNCTNLKHIVFETKLIFISNNVFEGCTSLEKIIFPFEVAHINSYAFKNCDNLKKIIFKSKIAPEINKNTFSYIPDDCIIYVPRNSKGYKNYKWWGLNIKYTPIIINPFAGGLSLTDNSIGNLSVCNDTGNLSLSKDRPKRNIFNFFSKFIEELNK